MELNIFIFVSKTINPCGYAATATALIESYCVENDVFRVVFGRGWSRDYT